MAAQLLGNGQHQVGRGRALAQLACKAQADHLRHQHGNRLAQHGCLSLNAADAPAQHTQAVDHGGVRVSADQRIRVGLPFAVYLGGKDAASQVLKVDLVADAHAGRHGAEVAESMLAPLEKGITLAVALGFKQRVDVVSIRRAELVDLNRVVDDKLGGLQRVDLLGVAAQQFHGIAHGSQVHNGGHTGKVLHQDASGHEGNFT